MSEETIKSGKVPEKTSRRTSMLKLIHLIIDLSSKDSEGEANGIISQIRASRVILEMDAPTARRFPVVNAPKSYRFHEVMVREQKRNFRQESDIKV